MHASWNNYAHESSGLLSCTFLSLLAPRLLPSWTYYVWTGDDITLWPGSCLRVRLYLPGKEFRTRSKRKKRFSRASLSFFWHSVDTFQNKKYFLSVFWPLLMVTWGPSSKGVSRGLCYLNWARRKHINFLNRTFVIVLRAPFKREIRK